MHAGCTSGFHTAAVSGFGVGSASGRCAGSASDVHAASDFQTGAVSGFDTGFAPEIRTGSGLHAGAVVSSAAADAAAVASCEASALPPAADRAAGILAGVRDGFRALGVYGVSFEVRSDEYVTRGRYAVEGEGYYLVLGDAEVYCDGAVRYEVDNRRREVTIDVVDTDSRNILNNPVHAFDFLGSEYAASLVGEQEGHAVVRLTPAPGNTSSAGNIVLTVDTAAMRPVSLRYDYDGEQVQVSVLGIKPLETPLKAFAKDNYAGYEFIDFR